MSTELKVTGRLAPTPSGHLHLGNALAFGACWLSVRAQSGRLLLRVEDVDVGRAREDVADSQRQDLEWLGLTWDEEVPRQSERDYGPWLERLRGHTYRCTCTRKELRAHDGRCPCADLDRDEGSVRFRLDPIVADFPDPVLRRRDGVYAYNLSVVADDIADGVTEVVRGGDLLEYVPVQEQIWRAFGATPPRWEHTPLVVGPDEKKLSKSHGSTEIRALREAGWTADRVWETVLPWLGLSGGLAEATARWSTRVVDRRVVIAAI